MEKIFDKEEDICCGYFEKVAGEFIWFSYVGDDGHKVYVMPCIENGGDRYRINHCPSCGAVVRSAQITQDKYDSFI